MKVLIDTCVVIDFLQKREPFAQAAKQILQAAATEKFVGCITAKAATDIYYLIRRSTQSEKESRRKLTQLLSLIGLLDTCVEDVLHAISSVVSDFEDAVMVETAIRLGISCIVTRNIKDYKNAKVPVYDPEEFLKILKL